MPNPTTTAARAAYQTARCGAGAARFDSSALAAVTSTGGGVGTTRAGSTATRTRGGAALSATTLTGFDAAGGRDDVGLGGRGELGREGADTAGGLGFGGNFGEDRASSPVSDHSESIASVDGGSDLRGPLAFGSSGFRLIARVRPQPTADLDASIHDQPYWTADSRRPAVHPNPLGRKPLTVSTPRATPGLASCCEESPTWSSRDSVAKV
jgi:hypothetical protein